MAGRKRRGRVRVLFTRSIEMAGLASMRRMIVTFGRRAGLDRRRAEGFALAVHEAATNTIQHASGSGRLTLRQDRRRRLWAEVSDTGPGVTTVGVGQRPPADAIGGRGVWLAKILCDRVVVRARGAGSVVRLEMRLTRGLRRMNPRLA